MEWFTAMNPATEQVIKKYRPDAAATVQKKLKAGLQAFASWKQTSFEERARILRKAAEILRNRKQEWAELMATEMGKPVAQGISEAEKCAWACEYYAQEAEAMLKPMEVPTDASRSYVTFEPLGLVLAIMPWNFPFWQVFRFLAPNLMAGNTAVLKHASNVPGCALAIQEMMQQAGLPDGVFQTLMVSSAAVKDLIAHPSIQAVTLTGSTEAGKAVARQAGAYLKKTVLELGGSDPYVILADADLDRAAEICVNSRLINSGQSCIAAKRFIVVKDILNAFTERFVALMQEKTMGDPMQEHVDIGPLARTDLRNQLHRQVQRSIQAGARCIIGGKIPKQKGAFYPPTVLTHVKKGMPAFDEELFGPVAAIIAAKDEQEAIQLANQTTFGLGAAVFTRDLQKGEQIAAHQLEAGNCFVNALVKSDPRLPFGGIKSSGYGRELGLFGIREFVNIKTVYMA
ncbi:NAD-dependent succinate-semialdehyde dehydrogenase [Thermoflavifilum thermophilum]|uniref:Succinate-semialdehyde dehydrogenase / glutarate-semialdehyde dehydrogenase n=1 Tax=Thermoflavifilum thermophilum TaxID=1393122 RepID=A0A1I7MZA4_9BACT|nr:NAD-dependent succinate-semialdehyde dehydrogenase [Thermoflavifilum thermophilum]SFV27757.1 succinate-semialdehyde dehydrogenase / glutarate-semialdehyde dehydrogenase [Thermoflavifilum thermophilum]